MHPKVLIAALAALVLMGCGNPRERISARLNQSPAGPNSSLPWLFSDRSGTTWMSWIEESDSLAFLRFSHHTDSGWSTPGTIATSTDWFLNWADYPTLASDGQGNLLAHVLERNGKGKFAYSVRMFQSSDNGATWPTSFLLNTDTIAGEHGFVSIQPTDKNGEWFITWLDGRNAGGSGHEHHGSMSLRAAIIGPQGKRISEGEIDAKTCDCCQTTALWTSHGPVIAYRDRSDDEIRDISVRRLESGLWSNAISPGTDNWQINGCPVNGPRLASHGASIGLVWFTAAADSTQVKFALSQDSARSFSKWVRVNTGHTAGRVDLIAISDQEFVVSWLEENDVMVRRITKEGVLGPTVMVARTTSGRSSGFPQIEQIGDKLLAAWTDTESNRIKVRLLEITE